MNNGHYKFKVMAFGLSSAPGTFQSAMNTTLAPILRKCALIFFDDILIYNKSLSEHIGHLRLVLQLLSTEHWQVKMSKCAFAQTRIAYLGHIICKEGVATDDSKIASIKKWLAPTNVREVRGFLGISGYYRKFFRHYGVISKLLTIFFEEGYSVCLDSYRIRSFSNPQEGPHLCSCSQPARFHQNICLRD
jgi:hypothetical protein